MAVTGQELPGLSKSAAANRAVRLWRGAVGQAKILWRPVQRVIEVAVLSSLTRRIIVLNLAGLLVLVFGILYLNQWRAGLIEARVQSLRVQGEIIAAAIAASATADSDVIQVDPDRLLELSGGQLNISPLSFVDPSLEFPINPERVAPLLRNLIAATKTRARIYDQAGFLILDSSNLYARGEILRRITSSDQSAGSGFFLFDWWNGFMAWLPRDSYPLYQEYGADEGARYPEVAAAMQASGPTAIVRVDAKHQLVVSVAVPIRRLTATVGVLMLSTDPGEIDKIEVAERWNIVRIALVAFVVTTLLSLLLAGTIAGPLRRLSAAAERVQAMSNRAEIPDFSNRTDEVGHLSRALRSMTGALYSRIEGIERFAADVAHELKNPLTSLRSAVETLPLASRAGDRERLHAIIQHDVRRLDRLISDISNASRLDAELARRNAERTDVEMLIETMVSIQQDVAAERQVNVVLDRHSGRYTPVAMGQDSRLAQVFANLLDNAVSFSPKGGTVRVTVRTSETAITVTVTDEGPGIRGDITRIFQRFYTDRPDGEHFGDHSGLGLAISKQIVEAHRGTIAAANRDDRSGAMFTVVLPRVAGEKPRK